MVSCRLTTDLEGSWTTTRIHPPTLARGPMRTYILGSRAKTLRGLCRENAAPALSMAARDAYWRKRRMLCSEEGNFHDILGFCRIATELHYLPVTHQPLTIHRFARLKPPSAYG